jgi:phage I-like protein
MPKKDLNQTAFDVVRRATGEVIPEPIDPKKKVAVESGRRGGLKGGNARAAALSAEERKAIAKKAARKRWDQR